MKRCFILFLNIAFLVFPFSYQSNAKEIADIVVGTPTDAVGLNHILTTQSEKSPIFTDWGNPTTIAVLACRFGNPAKLPITAITIPPNGGTLQISFYNAGNKEQQIRAFFDWFDGGTWEDSRLNARSIPVGVWTTVNFEVSKACYDEGINACRRTPNTDWDHDLTNGFQCRFRLCGADKFEFPANIAVHDIKMLDKKIWNFEIGSRVDLYQNGGPYLWTAQGWSERTTIHGVPCRVTLGNVIPTAEALTMTVDPDIKWMTVKYCDNDPANVPGFSIWCDYADGGSWQDDKVGDIPMTGKGGWKSITLPLAGELISEKAYDMRKGDFLAGGLPGKQVLFRLWPQGAFGNLTKRVPISEVILAD